MPQVSLGDVRHPSRVSRLQAEGLFLFPEDLLILIFYNSLSLSKPYGIFLMTLEGQSDNVVV